MMWRRVYRWHVRRVRHQEAMDRFCDVVSEFARRADEMTVSLDRYAATLKRVAAEG